MARGDELDAEQSVPLPAGGSVSRALQERDDSGDAERKEALVQRVMTVIEIRRPESSVCCGHQWSHIATQSSRLRPC